MGDAARTPMRPPVIGAGEAERGDAKGLRIGDAVSMLSFRCGDDAPESVGDGEAELPPS